MTMTKKEVIAAMEKKLDEMEEAEKEEINNHPTESASNIINLREKYYNEALKIAEDNGYTGGCKWQLWDVVVTRRARKLGIKPNPIAY